MSIHLEGMGLKTQTIGMLFCIPSIFFAIMCTMIYLLTSRLPKRIVIMMGITLMSVGMYFVGIESLFGYKNSLFFILFGLCLVGLAAGMTAIPIIPEVI